MTHPLLGNESIKLYNLYPRLLGSMTKWKDHIKRIKDMGFNTIWVNPFHYPGFSGSLYSPKDYYKYNPLFIDDSSSKSPKAQLKDFIKSCHKEGMLFIMDLVINHTAIDCTLIEEHPEWFKLDENGEVVNPGAMDNGEWITWGDLAEVDNENSPDKENLWDFWWKMMEHYMELGVDGFRCDMAYQVPSPLWDYLIQKSRAKKPGCLFLAESLGCDFKQVEELANRGFDYLFSSVKYWDYNEPWAMEQYNKTHKLAKSIAFPESHDTTRLIEDLNNDLAGVKRQLLFSALFCSGYMIPTGFEFGFKKALNVVKTDPTWWEETDIDLTEFIKKIAKLKKDYPVLSQEEGLEIVDQANWANIFCFKKTLANHKTIFIALNKDRHNHQHIYIPDLAAVLGSENYIDVSLEHSIEKLPRCLDYALRPSEIKIIAEA